MNEQQLAAVKQAVESMMDADRLLEDEGYGRAYQQEAITALQSIIQQPTPVQEPVAWVEYELGNHKKTAQPAPVQEWKALAEEQAEIIAKMTREKYPFVHVRIDASEAEKDDALREKLIELGWTPPAQPAQKPWVDLPDEEIDALAELHGLDYMSYAPFVRAIEQRLKEKNT
jgi:hypothetical protein